MRSDSKCKPGVTNTEYEKILMNFSMLCTVGVHGKQWNTKLT